MMFKLVTAFVLMSVQAYAADIPKMGKDEALMLFKRAGFALDGTVVKNRCRQPANPSVSFTDMNGDGTPEAIFIDAGPCYASGHWISILRQPAPRSWSLVLMAEGTAQPVQHRTDGWFDIALAQAGITKLLHYDGRRYVTAEGKPPGYAPPTMRETQAPKKTAPPPSAPQVPAGQAQGVPDAGSTLVKQKGVIKVVWSEEATPQQKAAVEVAVAAEPPDVQQDGMGAGYSVGEADLNSDGLPDLIVHANDSSLCGSRGCGAEAILATPKGYAPKFTELGIIFIQDMYVLPALHHGMHDLRYDDSTYVFRWNGKQYH